MLSCISAVRTSALKVMRRVRRSRWRIHVLHIGKNAGTALNTALAQVNACQANVEFVFHGHRYTLGDVPADEHCIFVLRDPASRFVSGFYSRKRQGLPRKLRPWSECEAASFSRFEHAVDLLDGLESRDITVRSFAGCAMEAIFHVNALQWDWIGPHWMTRKDCVVGILHHSTLEQDYVDLVRELHLPFCALPGPERSNRMGDLRHPELSPQNLCTLRSWYARDYFLCELSSSAWRSQATDRLRKVVKPWSGMNYERMP